MWRSEIGDSNRKCAFWITFADIFTALFSIFKNKPLLRELIPDDHVDFHSHILFGIDDGAKTPEDSVFLAKSLQQMGCRGLVTTPHIMYSVWENTPESILSRLEETRGMFAQNGLDIPIRAAARPTRSASATRPRRRDRCGNRGS